MELDRALDNGFALRSHLPVVVAPHCNSSTGEGGFAACHLRIVEKNTFLHIVGAQEEEDAAIVKGFYRSRSETSFSLSRSYPEWKPLQGQRNASQSPCSSAEAEFGSIPQLPGVSEVDVPALVQGLQSEGGFSMPQLLALSKEELLGLVPRNATGEMASVGSFGHAEGRCQPCIFMRGSGDCRKGLHCPFCHVLHDEASKKKRMRPSKKMRKKWARREWASRVEEEGTKEGQEDDRLADSFDPYDPLADSVCPGAPADEHSLSAPQSRGRACAGRAGPSCGGRTA